MLQIGNVAISGFTVLAPMAGVNSSSFRLMCRKHGAGLIYTQMYSVPFLIYKEAEGSLKDFLNILPEERPVSLQLIGSVRDNWENAVSVASKYADIIDLNLGCIEEDFVGKQAGAFLMRQPDYVEKIARMMVSASKKPLTAKLRSGWDDKSINAPEIAVLLERAGFSAIALHPRTGKQKYGGKADWGLIKNVKQAVSIPVIGNGDITLPGHAKAMLEKTGCDAVMIGRGAMKDPGIFERVNHIIEKGKNMQLEDKDGRKLILEFITLYERHEKRQSLNEIKDHCIWLLSGTKDVFSLREKIRKAKSVQDIVKEIIPLQ